MPGFVVKMKSGDKLEERCMVQGILENSRVIADASTCQLKMVHLPEERGEIASRDHAIDLHPPLHHGKV